MRRVFLDASMLVAMRLPRDQHAPSAKRIVDGFGRTGPWFYTSNWTLYESLALARRWGHESAVSLHREVSTHMTVVAVEPAVEAEALRRFLDWRDKGASVVDHANLLVALRMQCDAVISFDADFGPLVAGTPLKLLR